MALVALATVELRVKMPGVPAVYVWLPEFDWPCEKPAAAGQTPARERTAGGAERQAGIAERIGRARAGIGNRGRDGRGPADVEGPQQGGGREVVNRGRGRAAAGGRDDQVQIARVRGRRERIDISHRGNRQVEVAQSRAAQGATEEAVIAAVARIDAEGDAARTAQPRRAQIDQVAAVGVAADRSAQVQVEGQRGVGVGAQAAVEVQSAVSGEQARPGSDGMRAAAGLHQPRARAAGRAAGQGAAVDRHGARAGRRTGRSWPRPGCRR